jgi:hypothetical protein
MNGRVASAKSVEIDPLRSYYTHNTQGIVART